MASVLNIQFSVLTLVVSVVPDPVDEGLLAAEPLGDLLTNERLVLRVLTNERLVLRVLTNEKGVYYLIPAGQMGDHPAGGALEPSAGA